MTAAKTVLRMQLTKAGYELTSHLRMRIPGQIPGQTALMMFESANPAVMPTMAGPGPFLPLDAPVRSLTAATDGLGLASRQRSVLARAITEAERGATNEVVFRRSMMDTLREAMNNRERRSAALARAVAYFRHKRPERVKLVFKSKDHHPDHPDHPANGAIINRVRSLIAKAGPTGLSLRHLKELVGEHGKDKIAYALRALHGQIQHKSGRLFVAARGKQAVIKGEAQAAHAPGRMKMQTPATPKKNAPTLSPVQQVMQTRRALPAGTVRIWNTTDGHVRAMKMANGTWRVVGSADPPKDKKAPKLHPHLKHES